MKFLIVLRYTDVYGGLQRETDVVDSDVAGGQ
jgi:hypothetical protein